MNFNQTNANTGDVNTSLGSGQITQSRDRTFVWVQAKFVGYHRWKDAPDVAAFLRNYHRHLFHVWLEKEVISTDREIEFFNLQTQIKRWLNDHYEGSYFDSSCEDLAWSLLKHFSAHSVIVSEDGENGATVVRERTPVISPLGQSPGVIQGGTPTRPSQASVQPDFSEIRGGSPPPLPSQRICNKCFIGLEAEGPYRPSKTLFVPGSVSPEEFDLACDKYLSEMSSHTYKYVYFGAGNNRDLRRDTFKRIIEKFRNQLGVTLGVITVEVESKQNQHDILNGYYHNISCLVSLDPRDFGKVRYVKVFTDGFVHWIGGDGDDQMCYTTALDDPLYSQDEET